MKLTFLGHACFDLFDGAYHVLTDPYLTGNVLAAAKADEVAADFILVSHCHGDHLGDTLDITLHASDLRRTAFTLHYRVCRGATLIAEAATEMVAFDYQARKITALPPAFTAALTRLHGETA